MRVGHDVRPLVRQRIDHQHVHRRKLRRRFDSLAPITGIHQRVHDDQPRALRGIDEAVAPLRTGDDEIGREEHRAAHQVISPQAIPGVGALGEMQQERVRGAIPVTGLPVRLLEMMPDVGSEVVVDDAHLGTACLQPEYELARLVEFDACQHLVDEDDLESQ